MQIVASGARRRAAEVNVSLEANKTSGEQYLPIEMDNPPTKANDMALDPGNALEFR